MNAGDIDNLETEAEKAITKLGEEAHMWQKEAIMWRERHNDLVGILKRLATRSIFNLDDVIAPVEMKTGNCDGCHEEFKSNELESLQGSKEKFCPDCIADATEELENHEEFLSNQD